VPCSQAQERRIRALERELDASIVAAARSREEKRAAEIGQRAAEARAKEVLEELENTTSKSVNIYTILHPSAGSIFTVIFSVVSRHFTVLMVTLFLVYSSALQRPSNLSFSPFCRFIMHR
jgi:hypothetical protein